MNVVKMDISVMALGDDAPSLGRYIAHAQRVLQHYPHVEAHFNPMSTTLRGELTELLAVLAAMHQAPFELDAKRVITSVKLDDRRDEDPMAHGLLAKLDKVRAMAQAPA
jgi:uncharacterized protein (TIGR00106 family)